MRPLVLGSSSPYRKALLQKLGLPFTTDTPDIDETPDTDEPPGELARRLATEKAHAVGRRHPGALVIGSDQVAVLDGKSVGKPGGYDEAFAQLRHASGKETTLLNGLCLLNVDTGRIQQSIVPFSVRFRNLSDETITRYLLQEKPYDCTGAVRAEGPGIALLARLEGNDPNALIGLPLIELVSMLKNEGVSIFQSGV